QKDYLNEVVNGITKFEPQYKIFCLKAKYETILKRLETRGEKIDLGEENWSVRKAKLCIESHQQEGFGEAINTDKKEAIGVANEILNRLGKQA
ncbi:MAG TPA: hypothetical protein PKY82_24950, partial [Pyrinomonadaceae bacterium]|nr:hypothetical protein [Pyrinomonadaceae bacterium]